MIFSNKTSHLLSDKDFSIIIDSIMNASKDGIFITDHIGNVLMVNKASEDMLGLKAAEVIGMNVKELLNQGYYDKSVALLAIEKERTVTITQTSHTNNKILTTGIPIFEDNKLKFIFINDRDITHLSSYVSSIYFDKDLLNDHLKLEFTSQSLDVSSMFDIIIKSTSMQNVFKKIEKASQVDCPVILTGETGVGKTLFANIIHKLSTRHNKKFLEINCGAINSNLADSELFGYEKGAFTGAQSSGKVGVIEAATGGTLFLDEINSLPLTLQLKLLNFLDNNEIRRVGGISNIRINTRVIAATNDNIDLLVKDNLFRSDLYYRLNVLSIHIPPLREREEEIDFLIDYFMDYYSNKHNIVKTLSFNAKTKLKHYNYPGNVRELENIINRLIIFSDDKLITESDFPEYITNNLNDNNISYSNNSYKQYIAEQEAKYINDIISRLGSQQKAANFLGISQSTLSRKSRKV